jgi:hypothetical protein
MTVYTFRVHLLPNPPLGFEGDEDVRRDVEIDGSDTLAAFHEAIFDAFDRWDAHTYEFLTRDEHGIATRSYVSPGLYDGGPSWPAMDDDAIERFIDRAVPDDVSEEATERFRALRSSPPPEGNAAETTIDDLGIEPSGTLFYEFDMGDGWEHHIVCRETRPGSLGGPPRVVDERGEAPPQYRDEP